MAEERSGPTDVELLRRITRREEDPEAAREAFGIWVDRHGRFLWSLLLRRCRGLLDPAALEDVVAEAFCRSYERAETYDAARGARPRTWLVRIGEREAWQELRRRRRGPVMFTELFGDRDRDPFPANPRAPEKGTIRVLRVLIEELSRLTDTEREVLLWWAMYYGESPGRGEATAFAESLGKTPANVRQIRLRAKAKLLRALSERGVDPDDREVDGDERT